MDTLQALFENYAKTYPSHLAIEEGESRLSYAELNQKANQLAHHLIQLGAQPETLVVVCLERSVDFLISILAILKAGSAYLPIDGNQPKERLQFILKDSKAPILITRTYFQKQFDAFTGAFVFLDKEKHLIQNNATHNPPKQNQPSHLAYVIYTSGSTGTPKGVLIEQQSVIHYAQWMQEYTACKQQERVDFSSSPIFDMAVSVTIVSLILGLTIVLCEEETKKDPRQYLAHLAKAKIHIIKMTPSYFKVLTQESNAHFVPLPDLKALILGGENLGAKACLSWINLYPHHTLYNEYGPTETTVAVCAFPIHSKNITTIKNNIPIASKDWQINCHILDEQNHLVKPGDIGELAIGGIPLARGYLNQEELTQQRFIEHPALGRLYKTGDLCQKNPNHIIEYFGRIDDQIKIRGFRIEPGEIEKHLQKHPCFQEVTVVAQKDHAEEACLVAYYILKKNQLTPSQEALQDYLKPHIPEYMLPSSFIPVAFFPLNANGKLDKPALPQPLFERTKPYMPPKDALEKQLANLWSQELGIPDIGLDDNFFELGGHSLSAARLVSKINHDLHMHVSLHDFYQAACIQKLIPHLKKISQDYVLDEYMDENIPNIPLSDFQLALWMSKNFEPEAHQLNIVCRKRFQGPFNIEALHFAFQALIQKHEILRYQINTWRPFQRVNLSQHPFNVIQKDLRALSLTDTEKTLSRSMKELYRFKNWSQKLPLLRAKLFFLNNNTIELQCALPHLIADDASIHILFADLSAFYLSYLQNNTQIPKSESSYKKYVFKEQQLIRQYFEKNIHFWETYLKNSFLFSFPKQQILKKMKATPYSTYTKIPEKILYSFKALCEQQKISLSSGLSALLALSLRDCCGKEFTSSSLVMNYIKSTRDDSCYDDSLGCFIKIEPIKMKLSPNSHFKNLTAQIQQSTLESSDFQHCSNLTKLSAIGTFKQQRPTLRQRLIDFIMPKLAYCMRLPKHYQDIFQQSIGRLNRFKRNTSFLININIHHTFMSKPNTNISLFNLKNCKIHAPKQDSLAINNIFETSFYYEPNEDTFYLVLSANLKPEFREQIANQFIHCMRNESIHLASKRVLSKG